MEGFNQKQIIPVFFKSRFSMKRKFPTYNNLKNKTCFKKANFSLKTIHLKKSLALSLFNTDQYIVRSSLFQILPEICGSKNSFNLHDLVEEFLARPDLAISKKFENWEKHFCRFWIRYGCCHDFGCRLQHSFPSAFIEILQSNSFYRLMQLLVYVKDHTFFPNAVTVVLNKLRRNKIKRKWLRVLIALIFNLTLPDDRRFFQFWISVVEELHPRRYPFDISFSELGYRNILEIINTYDCWDRSTWKLYNLIEVWKKFPFNLKITYKVIRPILNRHLPTTLLIDVINCCNKSKVDAKEIYLVLVPKLSIPDVSEIQVLYSFCDTLEACGLSSYATSLREKLHKKGRKGTRQELLKYRLNILKSGKGILSFVDNEPGSVVDVAKQIFEILCSGSYSKSDIIFVIRNAVVMNNRQDKSILGLVVVMLLDEYVQAGDDSFSFELIKLCDGNGIELPFELPLEWGTLPQARLPFLIAEIYIKNNKFIEAFELLKKYRLIADTPMHWLLNNNGNIFLQVRVLNKLFEGITEVESSQVAYDILDKVVEMQSKFFKSRELTKHASNIINKNINDGHSRVYEFVMKYKAGRFLHKDTIRGLIVLLWRTNHQEKAFRLFSHVTEDIYQIPKFNKRPLTLIFFSNWLSEELLVFFHVFFKKFATYTFKKENERCINCSVYVELKVSKNSKRSTELIPINILDQDRTSLYDLKRRLINILQDVSPKLKLTFHSNWYQLDRESLRQHLRELKKEKLSRGFNTRPIEY